MFKKKGPPGKSPDGRYADFENSKPYSPGMIASLGQTDAQVPQSMQVSGSMW